MARESFAKIAVEFGVSVSTVSRAYDYANREQLEAAAERGETPLCSRWRRISVEEIAEV